MHRKVLHLALWEQADIIGFSKLRMSVLSEICGQYTFTHEDVDALKPNIHRMSHNEVFLPDFLKTQQKTLSKTSRGASRVWSELRARFGATRQNPAPYIEFMRSIGHVFDIPDIPDVYLGGDSPKPPWLVQHLQKIETASQYLEPDWPQELLIAYREVLDNYFQIAKGVTSKSQAEKCRVTTNQIHNVQCQIQSLINQGYSTAIVENCIRIAINHNRLDIHPPPFKP